jgi:hypothetical protein
MNWIGPFAEFPRETGFPHRNGIVYSMSEFIDRVNRYNGKTDVFVSLYSFDSLKPNGRPNYDSAKIQWLYFDLDNENCLQSAQILHTYLMENDICHMIFFSGRGFHFYISVVYPNLLQNKKDTILNAVTDIADKLGFKIGIDDSADIDGHTIGNIAQLVRVPNTYNPKRQRFCIPITSLDLKSLNFEEFKNLALTQRKISNVYGETSLDVKQFDVESKLRFEVPTEDLGGELDLELNIEKFLPCVKALLNRKVNKHRERFYIITYCKELGLPLKDTVKLLLKYLPAKTFVHCAHQERQPIWIYRRGDLNFPSCELLKKEGYCVRENCGLRR